MHGCRKPRSPSRAQSISTSNGQDDGPSNNDRNPPGQWKDADQNSPPLHSFRTDRRFHRMTGKIWGERTAIFRVLIVPLGWLRLLPVPSWLAAWLDVYDSSTAFTLVAATVLSDWDAGSRPGKISLHLLLVPVLSFAAGVLQMVAVAYGVARGSRS